MLPGFEAPAALLHEGLVGIVARVWYRRQSWQFGRLRAAVPRSYSRAQIRFRGWLAAFLGVAGYLNVRRPTRELLKIN